MLAMALNYYWWFFKKPSNRNRKHLPFIRFGLLLWKTKDYLKTSQRSKINFNSLLFYMRPNLNLREFWLNGKALSQLLTWTTPLQLPGLSSVSLKKKIEGQQILELLKLLKIRFCPRYINWTLYAETGLEKSRKTKRRRKLKLTKRF